MVRPTKRLSTLALALFQDEDQSTNGYRSDFYPEEQWECLLSRQERSSYLATAKMLDPDA